jgi:ATP-dependent helicase/DNAse subunit B
MHMTAVPGTSARESLRIGKKVAKVVSNIQGVKSVTQWVGRAPNAADTFGTHYSEFEVELNPTSGPEQRHILNRIREELLRTTFMESLNKTLPQLLTQKNLSLFFLKAFDKIIPRILEMETSLNTVFGSRSTLAVEKEFRIAVEGIPLVGKIDRIDLLTNQSLLVLDYKTGNVDFTPDHLAKGYNFQALLYWLGAEETLGISPAAMLFYDLKKGEIKRGLAREEMISSEAKKSLTRGHTMSSEKLDSLIQSGKEAMQTHATNIRAGNFAPKPSSEACRFCESIGFCREGVGYA